MESLHRAETVEMYERGVRLDRHPGRGDARQTGSTRGPVLSRESHQRHVGGGRCYCSGDCQHSETLCRTADGGIVTVQFPIQLLLVVNAGTLAILMQAPNSGEFTGCMFTERVPYCVLLYQYMALSQCGWRDTSRTLEKSASQMVLGARWASH
eukprot:m.1650962 g.1650962  ORF g.1650962 m.1650962 type:complete len:153 (+) comp89048_c0_seq1:254-712(+)